MVAWWHGAFMPRARAACMLWYGLRSRAAQALEGRPSARRSSCHMACHVYDLGAPSRETWQTTYNTAYCAGARAEHRLEGRSKGQAISRPRCLQSPGGPSPSVWEGWAQSRCKCGTPLCARGWADPCYVCTRTGRGCMRELCSRLRRRSAVCSDLCTQSLRISLPCSHTSAGVPPTLLRTNAA